jgi:hypothetical protein
VKIDYEVYIDPEDISIRGNVLASGDEEEDRKAEAWVIDQLDAGNEYAWCIARVTASARGRMGTAYLGAISCAGEQEFERVFLEDLKREARLELFEKLAQDALLDGTEETVPYLGEDVKADSAP